MLNAISLKYISVTKHVLFIVTNLNLFLSGLNYEHHMGNKQKNSEAQINFVASSSTLQFGVVEARGIQGNWAVTHGQEIYACTSCGKVYRYYRNLQSHIRQECGKEPHLLCPYCPHRTKIKSNLKKHIQIKHPVTGTQIVM
jgi:DNA-directed RNA polymerase subunit RPC12/RpoP